MKSIFKNTFIGAAFVFGAAGISHAQVKIGTSPETIDPSAILHLESNNKGFLPPRVALTGGTDATTIPVPATGTVVYNTATAGTAPNNIVPGLVVNQGTPASPKWANVQVFSDNSGGRVDKLRYLGAVNDARTVIIDNFYEFRVSRSGNVSNLQIRLVADPGSNHVLYYNRAGFTTPTTYGYNSGFTFTGGATGNWNIFQTMDPPNVVDGLLVGFIFLLSSPQRDRLIEGNLHHSPGQFVNAAFTSY